MFNNKRKAEQKQEKSKEMERRLVKMLWPVLGEMKQRVDRRLVKTFLGLVLAILMHRHRNNGLLLSELGGYLLGPEQCQAGTKRISNLVHSERWEAGVIENFLWQEGTKRVKELWEQGERPLVIWDESVLEKPESLQAEGLCAVRSSKAIRLKRIKPGFFNPPGGRPIFVPGFHWLKVLVVGRSGHPVLAQIRGWTTRGEQRSQKRTEESAVLSKIDEMWGKEVVHVWDRGFAGNPWLTQAFLQGTRFVLRWPKNYYLLDESEQLRKPGEISKGKRSWDHRLLWDARHHCESKTGVIAFPVFDPTHHQPLWLVIARRKNQSPWYLLTSEPAYSSHLAWQIVLAYARRWQIEMAIRFNKSELAFGALASSIGSLATSCSSSLLLPMPSYFLSSPLRQPPSLPGSSILFAIAQENGARLLRLRSTACAWPSPSFGFSTRPLFFPIYEIWDASCIAFHVKSKYDKNTGY